MSEIGWVLGRPKVTNDFFIVMGFHQGFALNPFLFTLVMDEFTKRIQDKLLWCMLFANDIVFIDKTKNGANNKLERLRHILESRGFRLSRSKTKYLHCGFCGWQKGGEVNIDKRVISKVEKFKYLDSIIQQKMDINEDINHLIKVSW